MNKYDFYQTNALKQRLKPLMMDFLKKKFENEQNECKEAFVSPYLMNDLNAQLKGRYT